MKMVGGGQRGGWHYGHRLRPRQISAEVARRERPHVSTAEDQLV